MGGGEVKDEQAVKRKRSVFVSFFFFSAVWLVGSLFPDQRLKLGPCQ